MISFFPFAIFVIQAVHIVSASTKRYIVTLQSPKGRSGSISTFAHIKKVENLFSSEYKARSSDQENEIGHIYNATSYIGYSATFSESVLNSVKAMDEVEDIEEDGKSYMSAVQYNAPWGLARISAGQKWSSYGKKPGYLYNPNGGEGVAVYVIDTGINVNHPEFEGRAVWGFNSMYGSPNTDDNGHGTHCAGTIASRSYGVAKKSTVVGVKVLDGEGGGSNSDIIAGINWAIKDKRGRKGNVINMSLGGAYSRAINRAVKAAVSSGFIVAVAAGNESSDACNVSPASEPDVITVGATSISDSMAAFSNWGSCVDVFAPGDQIESTWNNQNSKTISGTSMASPHVAGLAAYLISKGSAYGQASPSYVSEQIKSLAISGLIKNLGYGSPNLLINNGEEINNDPEYNSGYDDGYY